MDDVIRILSNYCIAHPNVSYHVSDSVHLPDRTIRRVTVRLSHLQYVFQDRYYYEPGRTDLNFLMRQVMLLVSQVMAVMDQYIADLDANQDKLPAREELQRDDA